MVTVYKGSYETLDYVQNGGGANSASRSGISGSRSYSDPSTGPFITFENGSKFRRSTGLYKSETWLEFRSPLNTETKRDYDGAISYYRSGGSGWHSDTLYADMRHEILSDASCSNIELPPQFPLNQRNMAVTKALNKLADQKVNIGENLATLSQTMKLATVPIAQIVKELKTVYTDKSLRKLVTQTYRSITRGKALDGPASIYLQYVYGWKPLMQDAYGLLELAQEKGDSPLLLNARDSSIDNYRLDAYDFDAVSRGVKASAGPHEVRSRVNCNLWARIDPNYSGVRTLNQLGLINPVSLAWELIPASFVVDWVLPIGPVLSALTAPAGLAFVNGSLSRRLSTTGEYKIDVRDVGGVTITQPLPATGLLRYEGYSRDELTNWPLPGYFYDPDPLRLGVDGSDRLFKFLALSILALPSLR